MVSLHWLKSNRAVAELVSIGSHPALITILAIAYLANRYAPTDKDFWTWWGLGTFLVVGPGTLHALYTWFKHHRLDIDISRREDRILPLMLASLGALVAGYLISSNSDLRTLSILSVVLAGMLISITIITFVWKISLHTATFSSFVTLMIVLRSPYFFALYPLVLPIAWARLTLKQHTPAQLLGGFLVGILITLASAWIFRL